MAKLTDIPAITLKASNSSGEQVLSIVRSEEEFYITLHGRYDGSHIQIDFDTLDRKQLSDIHAAIGLLLEENDWLLLKEGSND